MFDIWGDLLALVLTDHFILSENMRMKAIGTHRLKNLNVKIAH